MQPKIICFTPIKSSRLTYILNILFSEILDFKLSIVEQQHDFLAQYQIDSQPKDYFFYAAELPFQKLNDLNIPFLKLDKFLFETSINPALNLRIAKFETYTIGFSFEKGDMANSCFSFDILAWCFYLISRYEEYVSIEFDAHNRFSAYQSIAKKYDFLHLPMLNILAIKLVQRLFNINIDMSKKYAFQPSYDIDYMFAFLAKGYQRQLGALAKNMLQLDFKQIAFKTKVFLGKEKDPFDTFDYIDQLHALYANHIAFMKPIFFMLIGNWGKYDKNIDWKEKRYIAILNKLAEKYSIGLHPSYESNNVRENLFMEHKRLCHFVENAYKSRQHFLKLRFPQTYYNLLQAGIKEDYSMGYADALGFRASIATPFTWYDLYKEEISNLKVYSFAIMDVTLKNYLKLSPEAAKIEIENYINTYKSIGGLFIPLWHNSSLGNWEGWGSEWRTVYEFLLEKAAN